SRSRCCCGRIRSSNSVLDPRRPPPATSHPLLDSPPAIPTEVLMRRIGLAVVLAVSLLAPFVEAQKTVATIGILAFEPLPPIESFRQGLKELGYAEGKNVRLEYRYAEGRNERFPE